MTYSATFKDHVANPRNAGELEAATVVVEEMNPVCGDRLRLSLQIVDGRIRAARFVAYGCAPTLACASMLTELVQGRSINEARQLSRDDIVRALQGLPARKRHAASLAIEVLRSALAQQISIGGDSNVEGL